MILSTSHNFLFVHVPKTAGTALTAALEPFAVTGTRTAWRRFLRRLPLRERPNMAYFRKHETALDMSRKLGDHVFAGFFRFSVVRNPFDHAVSHYEYLKEFRNPKLAAAFQKMDFASYLDWRMTRRGLFVPFFTILPDQAHFVTAADGETLLVDQVFQFETLADDFDRLTRQLGLPALRMPRVNSTKAKSPGRSLSSYYDLQTVETVRRLYARDFRLFGYSTDLPADQRT